MKNKFNKKVYSIFFIIIGIFFFVANYSKAFNGPSESPGSGAGALYLDGNGNVALGTTTSTVTGFGKIFAVSSTSNPGIYLKATGGRSYIMYASSSGNLSFYDQTAGVDRLYIDASGNVTANVFVGTISGDMSAANVSSAVFGSLQGNGSFAFPASLGVATSSKTGLPQSLSVYGGGYFAQKLGIGTSSPSATLDVIASTTSVGLRVKGESGGTQNIANFISSAGTNVFSVGPTGTLSVAGITGLNKLSIATTTTSNGSSSLIVEGGGYFTGEVAVGTPTSNQSAVTKAYVDGLVGYWTSEGDYIREGSSNYHYGFGAIDPQTHYMVSLNHDSWAVANSFVARVSGHGLSNVNIANFWSSQDTVFSVDTEGDITSGGNSGISGTVDSTCGLASGTSFCMTDGLDSYNFVANGPVSGGLPVYFRAPPGDTAGGGFTFTTYDNSGVTKTHISGTNNLVSIDLGFSPTSGTGEENLFVVSSTINQTGGANGITRGLYINPTLTSAADWRSIEVTRGNSLFGTTSGNVGIATTTPGYSLTAVGTGYFSQPVIVGTPTTNSHAATKAYVDSAVSGISGSSWLQSGSFLYPSSTSWNIGIGTTTPSFSLDVVGTFRVSATTTISGNWQLGGAAQGNINMNNNNITSVNKLTVATIDPLYEIDGEKYATYVSDTIGVKTELYGKKQLKRINDKYSYIIDFKNAKKGSDEWLFWQTIDEGKNMKDITLSLTPEGGKAFLWYILLPEEKRIEILGDKLVTFSYHLVAPRHDAQLWPTNTNTDEKGIPLKLR